MQSFARKVCTSSALVHHSNNALFKQSINYTPLYQMSVKQHFKVTKKAMAQQEKQTIDSKKLYSFPHPIWSQEEVKNCPITSKQRITIGDSFAYYFIQSLRVGFDVMSGYKKIFPWQSSQVSERKWINRMIFLETVAGVPGFVAGMVRHLRSLRNMERDQGWIHTLIEEAENERVHLLTFLQVRQPSNIFRMGVIFAQVWYVALFSSLYIAFPRVTHRVVGYLEEEAVKTYTHCLSEIEKENSPLSHWKTKAAPEIAKGYWNLGENATMKDVVYAVRKDEEHHKDVNHDFADDYTQQQPNPYSPEQ